MLIYQRVKIWRFSWLEKYDVEQDMWWTCDELPEKAFRLSNWCSSFWKLRGDQVERAVFDAGRAHGHTVTRSQLGMVTRSESRMVNWNCPSHHVPSKTPTASRLFLFNAFRCCTGTGTMDLSWVLWPHYAAWWFLIPGLFRQPEKPCSKQTLFVLTYVLTPQCGT